MNKRALWPNLLTVTNLFLGFWAIMLISNGKLISGCWLIIIAGILDGLDGAVARLVRSSSAFGAQMDSLSDVVSFGVAPSVLVHFVIYERIGWIGIPLAFLPLLAGVLRLARFHIISVQKPGRRKYLGVPITGSGIIFAGFYLFKHTTGGADSDPRLWFSLVPAISLLMVSPIPYWKVPAFISKCARHPWRGMPLIILSFLAVLWNPALTIFPLMMIYVLLGPIEWGVEHLKKLRATREEDFIAGINNVERRRTKRRRR